jgi:hypothetical protein
MPTVTLARMRSVLLASVVSALAVSVLGAGAAAASSGCSAGTIVRTPSYVFALSIGPSETLYTPAQVKATHPGSGEVMLVGKIVDGMAGMEMGAGPRRHLAVHICTPAGKVVTGAHPAITVDGAIVPVAVMEGVDEGAADLHYGNNVNLGSNRKVTVVVTLAGQKAVFHTKLG